MQASIIQVIPSQSRVRLSSFSKEKHTGTGDASHRKKKSHESFLGTPVIGY
jgi:hypothetical protein